MEIHVLGKSRVGDFPTPPLGVGGCLAPTKIIDKKKRFLKINSPMAPDRFVTDLLLQFVCFKGIKEHPNVIPFPSSNLGKEGDKIVCRMGFKFRVY